MQGISMVKELLLWSALINYAILIVWFGVFVFFHDFLYAMHGRWFDIEKKSFDALHYGGMAIYKILVLVFNIVPLIVIWMVFR